MQQPFLRCLRLGAHDMSLCQSWPLPVDPNRLKVQAQGLRTSSFLPSWLAALPGSNMLGNENLKSSLWDVLETNKTDLRGCDL